MLFAAAAALSLRLAAAYTPLRPAPTPEITRAAEAYPGNRYLAKHLIDGNSATEYSSNGKGVEMFIEFHFAKPTFLRAFRHVDRNDPATIAASELTFFDAEGRTVGKASVKHANRPSGETLAVFPKPIRASRVRWQVRQLGPSGYGTVGGAEIQFLQAGSPEPLPRRDALEIDPLPFLEEDGASGLQPIRIRVRHPYAESAEATLRLGATRSISLQLQPGENLVQLKLPNADRPEDIPADLLVDGRKTVHARLARRPVRPLTVYILPHSHTDIGYTAPQAEIEKKQVNNLIEGIEAAERTADYPEGARFVWNVEVLWAADLYLRRLDEAQRARFLRAVRRGQVVLNGMYLNELTGLCRPEELIRLFRMATQAARATGVEIDSAMISDVPGYTWGVVTAMREAGIRYFSVAPNYFDRIGTILREWENKPFYWLGPDGRTKTLVWIPFWGYAMSHRYRQMSPQLVEDLCRALEKRGYPYEVTYVRWAGHGDNARPDPTICDFVRDWNRRYRRPRFVISGTAAPFVALEARYADRIPTARGDLTPYWEDGAGSSALETGMNRQSSDRLRQAETLFAMRAPEAYPQKAFEEAWRNVLLYSEHTWGAWCSVSRPESKETKEQWAVKRGYAVAADRQSHRLLQAALDAQPVGKTQPEAQIDFFNTLSWRRTAQAIVPELSRPGDRVLDETGRPVPSQRLRSGELLILARDVPAFGARRFTLAAGSAVAPETPAIASGNRLENGILRVELDPKTGGIRSLIDLRTGHDFVDLSGGETLNDYRYLLGDDPSRLQRNGPVTIRVGERGPLLASLIVESSAPGCRKLTREIRLAAGADWAEAIDLLDKERLKAKNYFAPEGKESVHIAFPFRVPEGRMVLDLPLARMTPEKDQLPGACKNWLTVGRWADVSNEKIGITWATLDAPLVEVGGITATLLNSQTDPDVWRKRIPRSQTLYSWALNNHWGTNYRAYQEGLIRFRYALRPHRAFDPAEASRFASGLSFPLLPATAQGETPPKPLLALDNPDILAIALKPAAEGRALILRLFNAGDAGGQTSIEWLGRKPTALFLSDTSEKRGPALCGPISVPALGLTTLRVEFGE